MELRDFFSGNWRALILVPAITAVLAGIVFVSSADPRYRASAVVTVTEYFAADSRAEVRAAIDDFDSALQSRRVVDIVTEEAPDAASYRIAAEAVGEGADVMVTFEAPTRATAENALDAGVREALTLVSESIGRQTGRLLVAADAVAADAVGDLQTIEDAAGAADLEAELARRSGDLLALRNQIASAAGNPIVQNELEATRAVKEAEIADIERQLLPWTNARARFDIAVASGADAALALRQVETNETDLRTQDLLQSLRSPEVSNLPDLLRVVVAATVVTAGAVVVMALLVGSDRRRGVREEYDVDDDDILDSLTGDDLDEGVDDDADDWDGWDLIGGSRDDAEVDVDESTSFESDDDGSDSDSGDDDDVVDSGDDDHDDDDVVDSAGSRGTRGRSGSSRTGK